jgi:hypothetical protein
MSETMKEIKELQGELERELEHCKTKISNSMDFDDCLPKVNAYKLNRSSKTILNRLENLFERTNCIKKSSIVLKILSIKNNSHNYDIVENLLSELDALSEVDFEKNIEQEISHSEKEKVLFISHSSEDHFYVKKIVELAEYIGVKDIVCTSLDGYKIPEGEDIYEYLKKQFTDKNIYLVTFLSNNYYNSAPCLNEMGAGWITSCKQTIFKHPDIDFSDINGAINKGRIMINLNDFTRINDFKDNLISFFGTENNNLNRWESIRDEKLKAIEVQYRSEKNKKALKKVEITKKAPKNNELECEFLFMNNESSGSICTKLELELKDSNDNLAKISLVGSNNEIFTREIKPTERRFETINISYEEIDKKENFNIYDFKVEDCTIKDYWS